MKRLLVCLLLVGVVGCGESEPAKETPANEAGSQAMKLDPNRKANALFVEAVQLIESAEAKSLGNAIKDYEQALMNIQTIIDDYSESDLAVKVISGEASFAGRTLADISLRITELRNPAAALEKLLEDAGGLRRWQKDEEGYIIGVSFRRIAITDTDLVLLEGLPKLNVVHDVHGISDAGLVHLKRLTSLWEVDITSGEITDAGLEHLKGLTNLAGLSLPGSEITDAGLVHLKGMTKLFELRLGGTTISDAGLAHLKGLADLTSLSLYDTQITDAGLVHLQGLTKLWRLRLPNSKITDAGLVHLKGMTNLHSLNLSGSQVTDAGVAELQKALPDCTITY